MKKPLNRLGTESIDTLDISANDEKQEIRSVTIKKGDLDENGEQKILVLDDLKIGDVITIELKEHVSIFGVDYLETLHLSVVESPGRFQRCHLLIKGGDEYLPVDITKLHNPDSVYDRGDIEIPQRSIIVPGKGLVLFNNPVNPEYKSQPTYEGEKKPEKTSLMSANQFFNISSISEEDKKEFAGLPQEDQHDIIKRSQHLLNTKSLSELFTPEVESVSVTRVEEIEQD